MQMVNGHNVIRVTTWMPQTFLSHQFLGTTRWRKNREGSSGSSKIRFYSAMNIWMLRMTLVGEEMRQIWETFHLVYMYILDDFHQLTNSSILLFSVTESLFAAGGYNTPTANAPYLPVTPLGLVAKNFHAAAASAAFSQVSSTDNRFLISIWIMNMQWDPTFLQMHKRYIAIRLGVVAHRQNGARYLIPTDHNDWSTITTLSSLQSRSISIIRKSHKFGPVRWWIDRDPA